MHLTSIYLGFCSLSLLHASAAAPTTAVNIASIRSPGILPPPSSASTCRNPPKRVEWRQMTRPQQEAYIKSVLCLANREAKSGIPGTVNRFDDHQAVHSVQTPSIHWVGHFVLWHRYFVATYERALREECGYQGGQPYWNWSRDARPDEPDSTAAFPEAVFGPGRDSFGGNGDPVVPTPEQNPLNLTGGTGGGCVRDGAFAVGRFRVNLGPSPGCLRRDFVPWILNSFADPALVREVLAQPDYASFARAIERVPSFDTPNIHGSGHFGVGGVLGTIGNAENSPGDPLFYLHHANLDHVFWQWQQKDLKTRLDQVGGPVAPFDYGGTNVTLEFKINVGKLAGDASLKQLLDTTSGVLCYTY